MFRNFLIVCFMLSGAGLAFAQYEVAPPNCDELKLACEQKEALGESGLGNCKRYRETCLVGHRRGDPYCTDLRTACLHKDQLGERGQGNCKRYRDECPN